MLIFAHYWGIDEVGVFVLPAILAIVALRWAERKAKRAAEERDVVAGAEEETSVD